MQKRLLRQKEDIVKLKALGHVLRNKVNYVAGEALTRLKEIDRCRKRQIEVVKYVLKTQAYKEFLMEISGAFNLWKMIM